MLDFTTVAAANKSSREEGMIPTTPMKMLLWHWGRLGGGPRYTLELARALTARLDVDLTLSLSRGNTALAEFAALPCPCDIVDTYSGLASFVAASARLPKIRATLRTMIAESGVEVVVATMPHVWSWFLAPAARKANVPLISIIHDAHTHPGDLNPLLQWRIRRELAAADGVVTLSDHVKRLLVEDYRYPEERIAVLPLGPFAYGEGVRTPRRFPRDRPFRFLFFGRLLAYKGLSLLIEAFRRVAAAHAEVELFVVGQGDLGSYRNSLAATPRVTVVNRWIDDGEISGFLAEADALVAPYTESSQSAAVAAAFGCGMPVVVTPVGGLAEQVEAGITGTIASEPTAASVAEAMEALLDAQVYERCAAAVHARYVAIDPWCHTAEALVAHCRRITARATAAATGPGI